MKHLLLKATTVATDQGTFEAVISTATIDREKDIVDPDGMVRALHKWMPTGKQIPLAWNHSTAAEDIIGTIDPASAKAVNGEVVVTGWIDQSTPRGAEAWRLVKTGVLGFSFGYLIPDGGAVKRAGGGNHIKELDVFEVTASPTPMNNDTRVLGWKATTTPTDETETDDQPPTSTQARILNSMIGQAQEFIASDPDPEDAAEMADVIETLEELRGEPDTEDEGEDAPAPEKALIPRAERVAARAGHLKAVWTAAYINSLPDSSFLYVEPGGSKDSEGKTTPRSLRHFPVKDENGNVDMPHLRNAMSRIPQSNLSQSVKDRCTAAAQRMMDAQKSVDVTGKEPSRARSVDPLRAKADALALEFASGGESLKKPPQPAQKTPPQLLPLGELKRRMREEMLTALSGIEEP
jgi:HK97 family phage prohead protease